MNITKEIAEFFMDQVVGSSYGHMAAIPNNRVTDSLCRMYTQHRAEMSKSEFAEFLRAVADRLTEESK